MGRSSDGFLPSVAFFFLTPQFFLSPPVRILPTLILLAAALLLAPPPLCLSSPLFFLAFSPVGFAPSPRGLYLRLRFVVFRLAFK
jgi:hypothetical protein